jgi:hypothetical protein
MSTKEGKPMITEDLIQGPQTPVRVIQAPPHLNDIVHDLKNCMSILLYWVETLETDGNADENNREDLKKLIGKMNCLIGQLPCRPIT